MSTEPSSAKPDHADLEAAIDALLAEIDATCTRFENPPPEGDDELAEYAAAVQAASDGKASRAPGADADSGDDDAARAVERAAETSGDLLEQAADELIEALESQVEQVQADASGGAGLGESPEGGADGADGPLEDAVDRMLAPDAAPVAPDPEPDDAQAAARNAAAMADLDEALDALLDGTFESAEGEAVDTAGVDTAPDPALMLDTPDATEPDAEAAAEPEADAAEDERTPEREPEPSTEPEAHAPPAESAEQSPKTSTPPVTPATSTPRVPGAASTPARIRAWVLARARGVGRSAVQAAGPLAARALMLLSKPLEGRPPRVRDSIGWVAIWTLFLALCVWLTVLVRSPQAPARDPDASGVAGVQAD